MGYVHNLETAQVAAVLTRRFLVYAYYHTVCSEAFMFAERAHLTNIIQQRGSREPFGTV